MRHPNDRITYSAIVDRPALTLPDGARLVVWVIVNVEEWSIARAMPRTVLPPPMGQPLMPDVPNWAWHEYGMRVGFWRLYDRLRDAHIVPTLAINGSVCRSYPRVARAALDAGWEFMGHGYHQIPTHLVSDQRKAVRDTIDALTEFSGRRPRGWESPGLTECFDTVDILAEEGIEYVADFVLDGQPCEIATSFGPILSVPYTVEINDIPMMAVQHHTSDEFFKRAIDHFDCLYKESETAMRVMALSVHPYISGVPHRIRYLEATLRHIKSHHGVVFWTGEQILDWYRTATAAPSR